MSKEIKDIPPQELKRIEDMAHADTPMYGTMSELLAHEFGYIKGAKAEYLRHLSPSLGSWPSSKPEIGPRWVNASERLSDVIHDVTMRLVGQVRTWFGTLEIQIGKVVGPHGNIFDPRTVEYLDESIPSSEPAKAQLEPQQQFQDWAEALRKTMYGNREDGLQFLVGTNEAYLHLTNLLRAEPAEESHPDEQWNRESARAAAKEAYKSFAGLPWEFDDWFDSTYPPAASRTTIEPGPFDEYLSSPPSVKPEREEPFTVWAHEYSDKIALDSPLSLRDHIGGEIYAALMAAYGRLFFGPWQTFEAGKPVGEVLLLTTSKIIVIGDWYEDGWRTPRSTWEPIPGSKFQKLKHIYGEKDVTHWMPKPQIQSPASPAVQQEDGEDVSVIDIILGGIALKDKVASLQSQLYTSQQERATLQQEVLSVKAEAAEYRNALIKIERLGTAVESPGVFESGRGWEVKKNKYAEIAAAFLAKYIQQTPTK